MEPKMIKTLVTKTITRKKKKSSRKKREESDVIFDYSHLED
ncbi:MAG: hypothetical protein Q8Q69_06800 [Nitrosopumilaceae archaeon]|jgi:hypothetical protein|nr:hypothetical protein [Nitrosopumilaceae archaeon]